MDFVCKIRGSWAQVGNDTGAYTINSGYNVGNLQLIDGSYVYTNSFSSTAISPNLKPERKTLGKLVWIYVS